MSYLCNPFFIFSLIFIGIYHITLLKQTLLFYAHLLECFLLFLDDNVHGESEKFSKSKNSASGCWLALA